MGLTLPPKIQDGSALIGVIGLGYVGLPLLHAFHSAGFRVIGFDVDRERINELCRGVDRTREVTEDELNCEALTLTFEFTA